MGMLRDLGFRIWVLEFRVYIVAIIGFRVWGLENEKISVEPPSKIHAHMTFLQGRSRHRSSPAVKSLSVRPF